MNFSKPKTIKAPAQKKVNPIKDMIEKAWAGLSMISLAAPGVNTRDTLPAKNISVLVFIILISYFALCGIWLNWQWIKGVRISGEWFYYTGISVLVFTAIEFFNIEKKVREFAIDKKIMFPNHNSLLENVIGRSKLYNIVTMIMGVVNFVWVILGIIFYDRALFIELLVIYIVIVVIRSACKKTNSARNIFMIESIFSIALLAFILLNHFLNY